MSHTPDIILRLPEVMRRTGLHRSTIYRKIISGTFPPQVQLSIRCIGWYESVITVWMADPMGWTPPAAAGAE